MFFLVAWLVWFLHPVLICSYPVQPDNVGWRKSLGEEEMLELKQRFWEAEVLVWEASEVSLLDATPPFPKPPLQGAQRHPLQYPFSLGGEVLRVELLLQAWH